MPVHYTGTDTLELLTEARNYNTDLVRRVLSRTRVLADAKAVAGNRQSLNCLDFGAGLGTFALPLRKAGRTVTCIETDPKLQKKLRQNGFAVHEAVKELGAQRFDFVYTLNVLEHIEDDRAAVRSISDMLNQNGELYVYVPAFSVLFSSLDTKVGHHRRYRKQQLAELVRSAGLKIERIRYVDTLGFFSSLAYRVARVADGRINRRALLIFDRMLFPCNRVLDPLFGWWFGKNLELIAVRP